MKSYWFIGSLVSFMFLYTGCVTDTVAPAKPSYQPGFYGLGHYGGEVYLTRLDATRAAEIAVRALRALPVTMLPVATDTKGPVAVVEVSDPSREPNAPRLLAELKVTKVVGTSDTLVELIVFEQVAGNYPSGQRRSLAGHSFYKAFEAKFMEERKLGSKS